jgi:hypothetical protein
MEVSGFWVFLFPLLRTDFLRREICTDAENSYVI